MPPSLLAALVFVVALAGCGAPPGPGAGATASPPTEARTALSTPPALGTPAPGLPTTFLETGGGDGRRLTLAVHEDGSARLFGVYGGDVEVDRSFRLTKAELRRVRTLFEGEGWRRVVPTPCCPTPRGADGTYLTVRVGGREVRITDEGSAYPTVFDDIRALHGELTGLAFRRSPTPTPRER